MIRAIVFDLDNTPVDFMSMKKLAVEAAIDAMIDAGLPLSREEAEREIFSIYDREGIEYQRVFDDLLETRLGHIDHKILAAGIVAIAYRIEPEHCDRGFATEAARAMTAFAFDQPDIQRVCAHTLSCDNASARILVKCGFESLGQVIEPEDGPVWRWELSRPQLPTM